MAEVEEGATVGATVFLRLDVTGVDIQVGHVDIEVQLTDEVGKSGNRVAKLEMPDVTEAIRNLAIDIDNGCICNQPLREGDVLAPCPIHGWVTH